MEGFIKNLFFGSPIILELYGISLSSYELALYKRNTQQICYAHITGSEVAASPRMVAPHAQNLAGRSHQQEPIHWVPHSE